MATDLEQIKKLREDKEAEIDSAKKLLDLEKARAASLSSSKNSEIINRETEVMTGEGAEDLAHSMKVFEFKNGIRVYAGTDKGIGYADHNEDRVAISPNENFVAVIDGMGGEGKRGDGEKAAHILAEELADNPNDTEGGIKIAMKRMAEDGLGDAGALFISARIVEKDGKKFLDPCQAGDCVMMVIKKNGEVSFRSKDESLVQGLVSAGQITEDEALYHRMRNVVSNAITGTGKSFDGIQKYDPVPLDDGDFVFLMSDGESDNFTAEGLGQLRKNSDLSAEQMFAYMAYQSNKRMRDFEKIAGKTAAQQDAVLEYREKHGIFPDGYKSAPKKDNRALVVMEIGGGKEEEKKLSMEEFNEILAKDAERWDQSDKLIPEPAKETEGKEFKEKLNQEEIDEVLVKIDELNKAPIKEPEIVEQKNIGVTEIDPNEKLTENQTGFLKKQLEAAGIVSKNIEDYTVQELERAKRILEKFRIDFPHVKDNKELLGAIAEVSYHIEKNTPVKQEQEQEQSSMDESEDPTDLMGKALRNINTITQNQPEEDPIAVLRKAIEDAQRAIEEGKAEEAKILKRLEEIRGNK